MRWTDQQLAEVLGRRGVPGASLSVDVSAPPFKLPPNQAGAFALGRLPAGQMNKTESAYAQHLELRRHAGEVLWFKFEGIKLRLADRTWYTPDFIVLPRSGVLEVHETKGFMREDANVKIKCAAAIYPFKFIVVRRRNGGWEFEEKS